MKPLKREVVVVGGGVAGGNAAVNLAGRGFKVTLISSDPLVYSRMTLSYALKGGVSNVDPYVIYTPNDLKKRGVEFINDKAEHVELDSNTIETRGGLKIEYDYLVVATGSKVAIPKVEGLDLNGVYTFISFEDVSKLNMEVFRAKKAVVVGAGMIGLLVADSLQSRGVKVTLIDMLPKPLLTAVEEPIANVMLSRITARGVRFIGGVTVERIFGRGRVEGVALSNGEKLESDIVVIATGVMSNTPEGLDTLKRGPGGAIETNERFQTRVSNVYAIGDCASSIDFITKKKTYRPLGILASYQAKLLPETFRGTSYEGFIPYQVEEAFGFVFIRLGINSFEAEKFGLSISRAYAEYRVPGVGIAKSVVLFERNSGKLLGWQSIGPIASYKSKVFENMIKDGGRVEDLEKKGIKIKG